MKETKTGAVLTVLSMMIFVIFLSAIGCKRISDEEQWRLCTKRARTSDALTACYKMACEIAEPCNATNSYYRLTLHQDIVLYLLSGDIDTARVLADKHSFNFDSTVRSLFSKLIINKQLDQAEKIFRLAPDLLPLDERQKIIGRSLPYNQNNCEIYQLYKLFELGQYDKEHGTVARFCLTSLLDADLDLVTTHVDMLEEIANEGGLPVGEQKLIYTILCYSLLKTGKLEKARTCVQEHEIDKDIIANMLATANPLAYVRAKLLL